MGKKHERQHEPEQHGRGSIGDMCVPYHSGEDRVAQMGFPMGHITGRMRELE